jgi:hypothetical protein
MVQKFKSLDEGTQGAWAGRENVFGKMPALMKDRASLMNAAVGAWACVAATCRDRSRVVGGLSW